MQITGLHRNIYKLYSYHKRHEIKNPHQNLAKYGEKYLHAVKQWDQLLNENVSLYTRQTITGISQATYYRYKKRIKELSIGIPLPSKRPKNLRRSKILETTIQKVFALRKENPTYGKDKITILLRRDHDIQIGFSTVGKIIKTLKAQGKIIKSRSAIRPRRKRIFKKHAQRWTYGMKSEKPGNLIQIDHMTVNKNGRTFKHFQAWDPITKTLFANVFSNATSLSAAKFLKMIMQDFPFLITSIQVDGGSEFMNEFEKTAKTLDLPLFVLPPRRPQWNGGVERGNRIMREEFYQDPSLLADDMKSMRIALKDFLKKYNTYRPHSKLQGMTPQEYTKTILKVAA